MPSPEAVVIPQVTTVDVRLDPVQTIINSMVLIVKSEELSGLNTWIYETAADLTPEERTNHALVLIGLHHAVIPTRLWKDFPAYLAHLESSDPITLRDKVLDSYLGFQPCEQAEVKLEADKESLLADVDFFLEFLINIFGEELIDIEVETKAHKLLNNPAQMQELIVTHLRTMWEKYFQAECERTRPMLADAVMAFDQKDFSGMTREEATKYITGRDIDFDCWGKTPGVSNQLVFVPSAHTGPYLGRFQYKNALGVVFGARLPKDTKIHAPDLSRNEITIRLSALADDVRLHVLKLIAEEGELRSQEIMERLEISQSAASRHLKQLSATGYLIERRCSGAKCYSLNSEQVQETLGAVSAFLLCD